MTQLREGFGILKVFGAFLGVMAVLVSGCRIEQDQRLPLMINLYSELRQYAAEHGGFFPSGPGGDATALGQLFPVYSARGKELAGLTGDINLAMRILKSGKQLTTNQTSWVYVEGLRSTDNQQVALFWEREPGVLPTGQRVQGVGHTVMLLSGQVTNIADADWSTFLDTQQSMRGKTR